MKKKKVLILDDSEIVVSLTSFLVEGLGYETIPFTCGDKALEYLESTSNPYPNLIIADHSLTTGGSLRKTGFKILNKLKSYGVDIPVIMASGNCKKEVIEKYKDLGIKSYICKDENDYIKVLTEEVEKILNV